MTNLTKVNISDTELLNKFERIIMNGRERFVLRCCREKYGNLREAIKNVIEGKNNEEKKISHLQKLSDNLFDNYDDWN